MMAVMPSPCNNCCRVVTKLIRLVCVAIVPCSLVASGCSSSTRNRETHHHEGPKVNISHFIANTATYKGKTVTLTLKIDEATAGGTGDSLRAYAGREARFSIPEAKAERAQIMIKIPEGLPLPESRRGDEVRVTFVCTQGSLRVGNEAKSIQLP